MKPVIVKVLRFGVVGEIRFFFFLRFLLGMIYTKCPAFEKRAGLCVVWGGGVVGVVGGGCV